MFLVCCVGIGLSVIFTKDYIYPIFTTAIAILIFLGLSLSFICETIYAISAQKFIDKESKNSTMALIKKYSKKLLNKLDAGNPGLDQARILLEEIFLGLRYWDIKEIDATLREINPNLGCCWDIETGLFEKERDNFVLKIFKTGTKIEFTKHFPV